MTEIVAMAFAAAFGTLFLILKFGRLRRVLAFDVYIDLVFTAILMWSMAGTYTGIMTAILAGGVLSATLYVLKRAFPPDSFTAKGWIKSDDPSVIDRWHQVIK